MFLGPHSIPTLPPASPARTAHSVARYTSGNVCTVYLYTVLLCWDVLSNTTSYLSPLWGTVEQIQTVSLSAVSTCPVISTVSVLLQSTFTTFPPLQLQRTSCHVAVYILSRLPPITFPYEKWAKVFRRSSRYSTKTEPRNKHWSLSPDRVFKSFTKL